MKENNVNLFKHLINFGQNNRPENIVDDYLDSIKIKNGENLFENLIEENIINHDYCNQ